LLSFWQAGLFSRFVTLKRQESRLSSPASGLSGRESGGEKGGTRARRRSMADALSDMSSASTGGSGRLSRIRRRSMTSAEIAGDTEPSAGPRPTSVGPLRSFRRKSSVTEHTVTEHTDMLRTPEQLANEEGRASTPARRSSASRFRMKSFSSAADGPESADGTSSPNTRRSSSSLVSSLLGSVKRDSSPGGGLEGGSAAPNGSDYDGGKPGIERAYSSSQVAGELVPIDHSVDDTNEATPARKSSPAALRASSRTELRSSSERRGSRSITGAMLDRVNTVTGRRLSSTDA
jgi:hypothetical protein